MTDKEKSPTPALPAASPPGNPAASPKSPAASPPRNPASNPSSPGAAPGILPPDHWANIAQGQTDDEETASEVATSTASITSSILRYRTIHGRRYHSEVGNAEYWGANDEQHSETMALNHHSITLQMGNKLFNAPLDTDKIQKVLDVGTGNGIWAIDFADEYENIEVVGTDISPIQPTWIPPNVKFEIEDCSSEWTFPEETFDYIHARWLIGSISDWTALYKEAYRALKPGGWFETHEPSAEVTSEDGTVTPDTALAQWEPIFIAGGEALGRTFDLYRHGIQRKSLEEAGFVDIQEVDLKTPVGSWPKDPTLKEHGTIQQMSWLNDIEGYVLFMSSTLGWSRVQIQVYIAQVRRELRSGQYHPLFKQKAVWGRKPE